jgi:hypothetical protein
MPDSPDRFDDLEAPPSEQEQAAAEELRVALETPSRVTAGADAELARALLVSWNPGDLTVEQHRTLVQEALAQRRGRVMRLSFRTSALLALAAAAALVVWSDRRTPESSGAPPAVAVSRSTQELFQERFAPIGGETSRVDRIAMARGADLRDNEFARWGVR